MITPAVLLQHVKARPFRPFEIRMASGMAFEIRDPKMLSVGQTNVLVFTLSREDPDIFEAWTSASLSLMSSVTDL